MACSPSAGRPNRGQGGGQSGLGKENASALIKELESQAQVAVGLEQYV
jgi:hypothetical protein